MQCRDFREVADSYLSDELLVETNHDVIAHLEACAGCRRELTARRELRTALRASFANAEELQPRSEFISRVQNDLQVAATSGAMKSNVHRRYWMIAAGLLVTLIFGVVAVWQRERAKTNPQMAKQNQPNSAAVKPTEVQPQADVAVDANMVLAKMSELAAGDHRDCAIGHRLPNKPISLEEAARKYDDAYANLTKAVLSRGDELTDIELVTAHACLFKGQWFGHVVVRHRGHLVSLLVTRLETTGDVANRKEKPPENTAAQVIACSRAEGYQVSCFRTARHAVFVVSDLEEGDNLALARRLAPSVYEHLMQAEHVA